MTKNLLRRLALSLPLSLCIHAAVSPLSFAQETPAPTYHVRFTTSAQAVEFSAVGTEQVRLEVYNESHAVVYDSGPATSGSVGWRQSGGLPAGTYTYKVTATDAQGQEVAAQSGQIRVGADGQPVVTPAGQGVITTSGDALENTDEYGTVRLRLQNRFGVNGALFEQAGQYDLVDQVFRSLTQQRNFRFEAREPYTFFKQGPEFHYGIPDNPTLVIGDTGVWLRKGGLRFPDGTTQTTAATGGGSGTGGLTAVAHDATLTGSGTTASPLGLANGSVTAQKLATANSPASGQVLGFNGTSLTWQNAATGGSGSLTLPFSSSTSSSSNAFGITNINTSSGSADAIVGVSEIAIGVKGISRNGIGVEGAGVTGVYGKSATGLGVLAEGAGFGVYSTGSDTGVYGGGSGSGGYGVRGVNSNNVGVSGIGRVGVRGETGVANGYGVEGINIRTTDGAGVRGVGFTGVIGTSPDGRFMGILGESNGNGVIGTGSIGVQGNSTDSAGSGVGIGVFGTGNFAGVAGTGLMAGGASATGVSGNSTPGIGVQGRSTQNIGVLAIGGKTGLVATRSTFGTTPTITGGYAAEFIGDIRIQGEGLATSGFRNISDRNMKSNFAAVNSRTILSRVASLPIQTWNYKSDSPSVLHIGPMAQDFHAAFRVGSDDKSINTVDAQGVALAAIKGLYQMMQEKDRQLSLQSRQIARLSREVQSLKAGRLRAKRGARRATR